MGLVDNAKGKQLELAIAVNALMEPLLTSLKIATRRLYAHTLKFTTKINNFVNALQI